MEGCNINGWTTIARFLRQSGVCQNDLAKVLEISPAALSQIKSGKYLLRPPQMERIIRFLNFDESAISDFYTELFNARMRDGKSDLVWQCSRRSALAKTEEEGELEPTAFSGAGGGAAAGRKMFRVPLASLPDVRGYEPALEPLDLYVSRNFPGSLPEASPESGLCALRVISQEPRLSLRLGSVLLVAARAYPKAGELCLLSLSDGQLLFREFSPDGARIVFLRPFENGSADFCWRRAEEPHKIAWIHPVREIILKMI